MKPGAGVKTSVPSGVSVTEPIGEPVMGSVMDTGVPPAVMGRPSTWVTVSGSPSGSLSLRSTGMVTGVSSGVMALSSRATGPSLTPVTVMVSVVEAVSPPASVTV